MPAVSHLGYLAAVKESVYGTNPAAGYTSQVIQSESLVVNQKHEFVAGIWASRESANLKVPMGIEAGGSITWEPDVEGILGMLLANLLPTEVTTDNGLGNGGVHTFTPTVPSNVLTSFSVLASRDTTPDATNIWAFTGCTCDKLSLTAAEGQTLKAVATISAQTGAKSAAGITPSYTTENPLVYHTGSVTVAGSSVACKSFKVDIDSGNHNKRGKLGSKLIQQQVAGVMKVSGELELYFDSLSQVNAFLASTDAAIVLTLTGTAVGTSTRTLTITIPVAQFTGTTPTLAGPGQELMLKLPFTAWTSGSGSPNKLIQVALTNSKRTAY